MDHSKITDPTHPSFGGSIRRDWTLAEYLSGRPIGDTIKVSNPTASPLTFRVHVGQDEDGASTGFVEVSVESGASVSLPSAWRAAIQSRDQFGKITGAGLAPMLDVVGEENS